MEAELHLAQAHVTKQSWVGLLEVGQEGRSRFPTHARFTAVTAFALDKLGRAAEAREMLDSLIRAGADDSLAIHTYVRIATRSGFLEDAIGVVEQVLGKESDREKKLRYLHVLHELVASKEPQCARAEEIAWQFGQLSNPEVEIEEGTFLMLWMTSTLSGELKIKTDRVQAFQQRLASFQVRFPNSRLMRGFKMPENPTFADIERMLEMVDPDFRRRHEHKKRLEQQLDRGQFPIPYVWRPKNVLENVSDTPSLWVLSKASQASPRKFNLTMVEAAWAPIALDGVRHRVPLLDLPALLVINDLKLFDSLFAAFPTVAVSQAVFAELRNVTKPMSASWGRQSCVEILDNLKQRFANVLCPASPNENDDEDQLSAKLTSDEIKRLAATGEYLLYSDDAIFRVYANVPDAFQPVVCTLDLLMFADKSGSLTLDQVAHAFSDLCRWNVGIVIPDRYLFANIPNSVLTARDLGKAVDILRLDPRLGPMLSKLWDITRPYQQLSKEAAELISRWLNNTDNRLETVQALVGLWHLKVRLHGGIASMKSLDQLIFVIVHASVHATYESAIAKRYWSVFKSVVALEYGDRMETVVERQAIESLASAMARIAFDLAQEGKRDQQFVDFLPSGLTEGTAEHDWYEAKHKETWVRLGIEADKRKNHQIADM